MIDRYPQVETHPKGGWKENGWKVLLGTHIVNMVVSALHSTAIQEH